MYCLVTGASGVLGKCFCTELAGSGYDLYITGRNADKLEGVKSGLNEKFPQTDVRCFACDLTSESEREALFADAAKYEYLYVINCAGADIQKPLCEYTQKKLTFQARVNFEAAAAICLFAAKNGKSGLKIINISSISGATPMPNFALYSAAKGALTSFSQSINEELKGSGITCTAIVAGAFYSRPDVIENIKSQGLWGKIAAKSPEFVVKQSLKAANKRKSKYIVGRANRFMNAFLKLLPSKIKFWYIKNRWAKTRKDAF